MSNSTYELIVALLKRNWLSYILEEPCVWHETHGTGQATLLYCPLVKLSNCLAVSLTSFITWSHTQVRRVGVLWVWTKGVHTHNAFKGEEKFACHIERWTTGSESVNFWQSGCLQSLFAQTKYKRKFQTIYQVISDLNVQIAFFRDLLIHIGTPKGPSIIYVRTATEGPK